MKEFYTLAFTNKTKHVFSCLLSLLVSIAVYAQPSAPTSVTASSGNTKVLVSFTPSSTFGTGATAIAYYTVFIYSGGGSQTAIGTTSPIQITGLNNGTAYTFKVTATNNAATPVTSAASTVSNSVTPSTSISWSGKAGDGFWATGNNWNGGSVPTANDNVTIGNYAVTIASGVTALANTITLTTAGGSITNNGSLTIYGATGSTAQPLNITGTSVVNNGTLSITSNVSGYAAITMIGGTFTNNIGSTLALSSSAAVTSCINSTSGINNINLSGTINAVAGANSWIIHLTGGTTTLGGTGFTLGSLGSGVAYGMFYVSAGSLTINAGVSLVSYLNYSTASTAHNFITGTATFTNNGSITVNPATTQGTNSIFPLKITTNNGSTVNITNAGTYTYTGTNTGLVISPPASGTTSAGTINFTNSGTISLVQSGGTAISLGYPLNAAIINSGTMNLAGSNAILCNAVSAYPCTQSLTNTGTINITGGGINCAYYPGGTGYSAIGIANNTNGIINFNYAANTNAINVTGNSFAQSTAYTVGQIINNNGYLYVVTTVGTSGSSAPAWSTTVGTTVTSGTAVFTNISLAVLTNSGGTIGGYNTTFPNGTLVTNTTPLGILAPSANGSGIGTITLPSAYNLYGTFSPQITSIVGYGTIGGSSLNLGNASLVITSSYTPTAGTEYYVTSDSSTGNFRNISFTTLTGGWGVDYSTASTNGYGVIYYTTPNAPTNISAIVGNQNAIISFTPPDSGGVTSYIVTPYIGATAQATTSGSSSPVSVSGLTNGIAYTFTVTAINPAGSTESSASGIFTPNRPPSAPTIVSATAGDGNALIFFNIPNSLGAGATSITSYTVTSNGGTNQLTVSGSFSPIQIIGLINGTAYSFTVTATNNLGATGPASAASSIVTPIIDGAIDSVFFVSAGATLASGGTGTVKSSVLLHGVVSPGNTPYTASLNTGAFNFSTLSTYKFDISNATGTAGSSSGWDLINSSGAVSLPSSGIITIDITAPASGTGFNNTTAYTWTIAKGTSISGLNTNNFTLLTNNFQPSLAGTFSIVQLGNNINLVYTPFPVVTLSSISYSINPFANQCTNTASSPYSFTVTGNYLLDNVIITPPTGFQISQTAGSGYTTGALNLSPTSGSVNTTIYVEFIPNSAISYSGNYITVATSGTTTQNIPVSGTGNVAPTLSSTTSSNAAICSGSSATVSLTGLLANSTSTISYTIGGTTGTKTASGIVANSSGSANFLTIPLTTANSLQLITITSITLTDTDFCSTSFNTGNTDTLPTVSANVTPTVTITTSSNPFCTGLSVTFTAAPLNGGTPSFQWKINGTNVGTNSTSYSDVGINNGDVISCVMTANNSCQTSSTATSNSITEVTSAVNTINPTSPVGTTTQTVNYNTSITNITYATTNAAGAIFSGLPSGISGVWANNTVTISGTSALVGTFNYMVALTGGCSNATASGSITINKANSSITATGNTSYTYTGLAQGPASNTESGSTGSITYSYSGTGSTTYSASSIPPTAAGTYQVIATVAADANYNGASSSALAFIINKVTLNITAANQSVSYGTPVSSVTGAETFTTTGFVNGENASVISGSLSYTTTYTSTTPAATGGITITPVVSGLSAANYTFSSVNGAITVLFANITWTGSGGDSLWNTGNNWNLSRVPTAYDNVTIGNYIVRIDSGVTALANTITLTTAGGSITNNGSLTIYGATGSTTQPLNIAGSSVINNGTLSITSNVNLYSTIVMTGGTFTSNPGSSLTLNSSTAATNCINSTGGINNINLSGTINAVAGANSWIIHLTGGTTTLGGTGFTLGSLGSGVAYGMFYVSAGSLTINAGVSLVSYLNYSTASTAHNFITGTATFTNNGSITVNPATTQGTNSIFPLKITTNNGSTVNITNAGTYTYTGTNTGLVISPPASGTTSAGTINFTNSGTISLVQSGGTAISLGYPLNAAIINSGTMNLAGSNAILCNAVSAYPCTQSLTNTGTINITGGGINCAYYPGGTGYSAIGIVNNTNGIINFNYAANTNAINVTGNSFAQSTAYTVGQVINNNGYLYVVTTVGTSGSSAPAWSTTVGTTVTSGTAVFTNISLAVLTNSGGTIGGYNAIFPNGTLVTNTSPLGTIAPSANGASIGTITLPNGYTLIGKLMPQIKSTSAYGQLVCPTLNVTGATLQIAPNYSPSFGDSLTLVKSTTSQTSPFSSVNLPLGWSVNYSKVNYISVKYQGPTLGTFTVASKTYGAASFALTAPTSNSSGAFSYSSSNTSVATISGSTVTIVGAGTATITATQAAYGSYLSGGITAVLTVNKATITITAANQSVVYGTADTSVTGAGSYTPTGFVNGETASVISGTVSYTTNYTATSSVSATGIVITPIITGLTANNYNFIAVNGTITVLSPTASYTWTGAVSSDWGNPANWSNNIVPTTSNDITIPANPLNTLLLKSDLTVSGVNISGNILLNGFTLTVNGNVTGTGVFTGSPTSSLKFWGSSSGTLYFDQTTTNATNVLNSLTINTMGNINLGNALSVKETVFPTSGTLTTVGNLTLLSDSTGTARIDQVLGTISGNVNFQRFIPAKAARKYSFLGSPVTNSIRNGWQQQAYITGSGTGGSICGTTSGDGIISADKYNTNGFDVTATNTASMFTYNATPINGSRWVSIQNTDQTNLLPGRGYMINIRGNRNSSVVNCNDQLNTSTPTPPEAVTLSVTGAVTHGNVVVNLNDTSGQKYTLIANPYPSQISYTAFQASNSAINNKMWTYSPFGNGNYTTYSAGIMVNGATGYDNTHGDYVAVGQAFFVEANKNGNVTFQETHKVSGTIPNTQYFGEKSIEPLFRARLLTLTDKLLDEIVVRFNSKGSSGYNEANDAVSFSSANESLVSLKGSKKLAIATHQLLVTTDTTQLGVTSKASEALRFFFEFQGLDTNQSITLIDNFLRSSQNIRTSPIYNFNSTADTASQGNNRFVVVVGNNTLLSVNPISLSVAQNEEGAGIKWSIVNQTNINSYAVERCTNNLNFTGIKNVNIQSDSNYEIEDNNLPDSVSILYYRIKAMANNGSYRYSNSSLLSIHHLPQTTMTIYPNPVQYKLNITFDSVFNGNYQAEITTITGVEVFSKKGIVAFDNSITLDASILESGLYFIEIADEKGIIRKGKFMKE